MLLWWGIVGVCFAAWVAFVVALVAVAVLG